MSKLERLGKVFETDVLVIGGGVSGLWAANKATEFVARVLIVDKGPQDWGGLASQAGGDFDAVLPGEDVDEFLKELVYYYDGLCEQDLVEQILLQSIHRLEDYERLGHRFVREPDGKLKGIPQRGLGHIKCCIYRPYGKGGKNMVRVLIEEVNRRGVKRLCRTLVTDLLKHDGKVVGAVGFNTISGEFYIFKASAVILATGQAGWKAGHHGNTTTGEGLAMALRAGAELKNCEFARVWNFAKPFTWEGQTTLLPLGAKFVNARGETFMGKYSPILGNNTDPHYNVLGMAIEAREGRGPFHLDCSAMKPEDIELVKPGAGWQKLNYERLIELGINFFEDKTEWVPQLTGSYEGLVVDTEGRTKLPGLFAAGTIAAVEPGVYMGGWNLCRTAVTGHIAGESAGIYIRSHVQLRIEEDEVKTLKSQLFAPMGKVGIPPKEVLTKIQQTVFPYEVCILKSDVSLKRALSKIESLKNELLPQMAAKDTHYLMKLIEVRSIALTSELYLRASLMRTESRAGHYREDYPDRDNKNWLKWIIVSQENNKLHLRTEPVPFARYKFKPTRYYMDNFRFSK